MGGIGHVVTSCCHVLGRRGCSYGLSGQLHHGTTTTTGGGSNVSPAVHSARRILNASSEDPDDPDKSDDPFKDESCWIKANPLLGVSIQHKFVREQVREAEGMPSKEALVRRLHFCQWTEGAEGWVTRQVWESVEAEIRLEDYQGGNAFLNYIRIKECREWIW